MSSIVPPPAQPEDSPSQTGGPGDTLARRKDGGARAASDRVDADSAAVATLAGGMVLGAFFPHPAQADATDREDASRQADELARSQAADHGPHVQAAAASSAAFAHEHTVHQAASGTAASQADGGPTQPTHALGGVPIREPGHGEHRAALDAADSEAQSQRDGGTASSPDAKAAGSETVASHLSNGSDTGAPAAAAPAQTLSQLVDEIIQDLARPSTPHPSPSGAEIVDDVTSHLSTDVGSSVSDGLSSLGHLDLIEKASGIDAQAVTDGVATSLEAGIGSLATLADDLGSSITASVGDHMTPAGNLLGTGIGSPSDPVEQVGASVDHALSAAQSIDTAPVAGILASTLGPTTPSAGSGLHDRLDDVSGSLASSAATTLHDVGSVAPSSPGSSGGAAAQPASGTDAISPAHEATAAATETAGSAAIEVAHGATSTAASAWSGSLPDLHLGFLGQSYADLHHGDLGPHPDQGLLHGLV